MQSGFMPGKGTTDAIFILKQMQEKHREKKSEFILHLLTWKRLLIGYLEKSQDGLYEN